MNAEINSILDSFLENNHFHGHYIWVVIKKLQKKFTLRKLIKILEFYEVNEEVKNNLIVEVLLTHII